MMKEVAVILTVTVALTHPQLKRTLLYYENCAHTKKIKARARSLVLPVGSLQLILNLDELLPGGVMTKKQQDR